MNRHQKNFVADFKIADGKFKTSTKFATETSFVPGILMFGKNIGLRGFSI